MPVSSERVVAPHRAERRRELLTSCKPVHRLTGGVQAPRAACVPLIEGLAEGFKPACLPHKSKKAERSVSFRFTIYRFP